MLNVVLMEPEIPHNTGAIGRTCVATGTKLHLIEPLGFKLEDKWIKRTGLDYWEKLNYTCYKDWQTFSQLQTHKRFFFATTKAEKIYTEIQFREGDFLIFGKESAGIPEELLVQYPENCLRIPMWGEIRSLNLSNAVSVVLYEAYRQLGFPSFKLQGNLHRLQWKKEAP